MKKAKSNFFNMFVCLLVVCIASATALSLVKKATDAPIQQARNAQQEQAIKDVLPAFDLLQTKKKAMEISQKQSSLHKTAAADSLVLYHAFKKGKPVGTAVETFSNKGFGGEVRMMVGFLTDGSIYKTCVIKHAETPGLGSKMAEPPFGKQFEGKHPTRFKLQVRKDGGDVQAITAATISSRAYCDALNTAYSSIKPK